MIAGAVVIAERAPAVERRWRGGERERGVHLSAGDVRHFVITSGMGAAVLAAAVLHKLALGFLEVLGAGHDASPSDEVLRAL